MTHFIGIEGGGTKFVCVHGSSPENLQDRTVIKTQSPENTMRDVIAYIHAVQTKTKVDAIGLAIFGPLDLEQTSATYGYVTTAAKPGWAQYNVVGALKQAFDLPIGFDTDVNGSAIGEYRWGAGHDLSDFLYLTIGTGIGGGAMVNGKLLHGASHPEMGHILIPQDTHRDSFEGVCPYHKNCLESLASGPSMKTRWKVNSALDLPEYHEAWDLEAHYLAIGLTNYILTLSPKRIIMGGGVMRQTHLLPKIRAEIVKCLNSYIKDDKIIQHLDTYIVNPGLGEDSGICGAIALAEKAFSERN